MKLTVRKDSLNMNPEQILRRAGYGYFSSRNGGEDSFTKRLGRNNYPHFHVYIMDQGEYVVFNMHLDQKQASYQGSHAHSGEYDGDLVAAEIERLKMFLR
jgi:hypothetical protein